MYWTAECEVLLARGQFVTELLVVERGWAKLGGTDGAAGTGDGWGAGACICEAVRPNG
eukprot:COSAG05_NODE_6027_length_1039_cov_1.015957_2_plen_58_part_00